MEQIEPGRNSKVHLANIRSETLQVDPFFQGRHQLIVILEIANQQLEIIYMNEKSYR